MNQKTLRKKMVKILDKWATEWNNDISSEQPADQILELFEQAKQQALSEQIKEIEGLPAMVREWKSSDGYWMSETEINKLKVLSILKEKR